MTLLGSCPPLISLLVNHRYAWFKFLLYSYKVGEHSFAEYEVEMTLSFSYEQ